MGRLFYKILGAATAISMLCSASAYGNEEVRELLLETLNNVEEIVFENPWMSPDIQVQVNQARELVLFASPEELSDFPEHLYPHLRVLAMGTRQVATSHDSAMRIRQENARLPASTSGDGSPYDDGPLPDPIFPEVGVNWEFAWGNIGLPFEVADSTDGRKGFCIWPGYNVETRFAQLNLTTAAEAIKDIAEQFCGQTAVVNASVACVATDIVAYVMIGLERNQELCNDSVTAAEVSATWNGLKTVHSNLQHVYNGVDHIDDDLLDLEGSIAALTSNLATHDGDVKGLLAQIAKKLTIMMGDLRTVIELLNTPQGIRPDWPIKNNGR